MKIFLCNDTYKLRNVGGNFKDYIFLNEKKATKILGDLPLTKTKRKRKNKNILFIEKKKKKKKT